MKTPEQQLADLTAVLEVTEQMQREREAEHRAVKAERDRLQKVVDELVKGLVLEADTVADYTDASEEEHIPPSIREAIVARVEDVFAEDAPTAYAYLREREEAEINAKHTVPAKKGPDDVQPFNVGKLRGSWAHLDWQGRSSEELVNEVRNAPH